MISKIYYNKNVYLIIFYYLFVNNNYINFYLSLSNKIIYKFTYFIIITNYKFNLNIKNILNIKI